MIHITVLLEINDRASFNEFESKAIKIMKKYHGTLVSAFIPNESESSLSNIGEVHCLEFPDIGAFNQYRSDPALKELSELRVKAILNTEILVSGTNVTYG